MNSILPVPPFFDPEKVNQVWKVPYQTRAQEAREWAARHRIRPAYEDGFRLALLLVDVQNTFCLPDFELYVGGRSGTGAVDDNRRLAGFIYQHLHLISEISVTLDTHQAMQIFHALFLIDENGDHPGPLTLITAEDVEKGRWRFNAELAPSLNITPEYGQRFLLHYVQELKEREKYDLTIWPYHAMLGGIGHALVSSIEEAIFFHTVARKSQMDYNIKGNNPLTESYSVIGPEVQYDQRGEKIGGKSGKFIQKLKQMDALVIAGQAKSHCVAWTIGDLLEDIQAEDPALAGKVYLLEDCTSPVVVPGVVDYTRQADEAFTRFAEAGMHRVTTREALHSWPGMEILTHAQPSG